MREKERERERRTERDRDTTLEWLHSAPSVCYALAEHNRALFEQSVAEKWTASGDSGAAKEKRSAVCWSTTPLRRFHRNHFLFCARNTWITCRYFLRSLCCLSNWDWLVKSVLSAAVMCINTIRGRIYITRSRSGFWGVFFSLERVNLSGCNPGNVFSKIIHIKQTLRGLQWQSQDHRRRRGRGSVTWHKRNKNIMLFWTLGKQ